MIKRITGKSGFTFLELIIAISIIGILAAMSASSYSSVLKKSRDAKRKGDIEEIRAALELYKSTNGNYPLTMNELLGPTVYLQRLPIDPLSGQGYSYKYEALSGGSSCNNSLVPCTTYKIGAKLEAAHTCSNVLASSCYGATSCNYCLGPYGELASNVISPGAPTPTGGIPPTVTPGATSTPGAPTPTSGSSTPTPQPGLPNAPTFSCGTYDSSSNTLPLTVSWTPSANGVYLSVWSSTTYFFNSKFVPSSPVTISSIDNVGSTPAVPNGVNLGMRISYDQSNWVYYAGGFNCSAAVVTPTPGGPTETPGPTTSSSETCASYCSSSYGASSVCTPGVANHGGTGSCISYYYGWSDDDGSLGCNTSTTGNICCCY